MLAFLLVPSASPIPKAFLSTDLKPLLPVEALAGQPRHAVTRGSTWQKGGLVRLNYYYLFPTGKGPDLQMILKERGFAEQYFGNSPELRAARAENGIRQVVSVVDLKPGAYWKWARATGPARLVTVSEFPLTGKVPPGWHQDPILQKPPLPPTFPPPYPFLKGYEVQAVISQPLIPRGFRSTFWTQTFVTVPGNPQSVIDQMTRDLSHQEWEVKPVAKLVRAERRDRMTGLISIEAIPDPGNARTEIRFNYSYDDPDNLPRIID